MAANRRKDSVDVTVLRKWSGYFIGVAKPDHYNEPFLAPTEWWLGVGDVAREWLVTAGGNECLIDEIEGFVRGFNVRELICPYFLFQFIYLYNFQRDFAD